MTSADAHSEMVGGASPGLEDGTLRAGPRTWAWVGRRGLVRRDVVGSSDFFSGELKTFPHAAVPPRAVNR